MMRTFWHLRRFHFAPPHVSPCFSNGLVSTFFLSFSPGPHWFLKIADGPSSNVFASLKFARPPAFLFLEFLHRYMIFRHPSWWVAHVPHATGLVLPLFLVQFKGKHPFPENPPPFPASLPVPRSLFQLSLRGNFLRLRFLLRNSVHELTHEYYSFCCLMRCGLFFLPLRPRSFFSTASLLNLSFPFLLRFFLMLSIVLKSRRLTRPDSIFSRRLLPTQL